MFLHTLYDAFDKFADNESTQMFTGSITLRMQRGRNGLLRDYDICQYIGNKYLNKNQPKLYFHPRSFPPPDTFDTISKNENYLELKKWICRRSIECGCPVLLNGSRRGINGTRKQTFACCFKHRMHRGINKENVCSYRVDTIVNSDKKGRRIDGRKICRRTTTSLSNVVGKCCKFCFHLNFDNYGYFIEERTRWPNHCNHPKVNPDSLPMPSRLLLKIEIENIIALYESCAGTGVTRNFLMTKYGRFFSKSSIAYSGSSSQISNKHI